MSGGVVEVAGVSKRFGEVQALHDVRLEVGRGEVLGLLGPNGAGKTTLVRVIATLTAADAGTVTVDGFDAATDPERVRRRIGLAGQSAAVDELLTARENLDLIGRLYGLEPAEVDRHAEQLLERVGLGDAADRRAGSYSGGMRRKLDLAVTLIGDPAVLLMDEPTAGLDPRTRNEVWDLIESTVAGGTTVVLTSQHLDEIDRLAARVVVLQRGRVIAEGTPADLKRRVGGHVVDARFARAADLVPASAALLDATGRTATADPSRSQLTLASDGRAGDLAVAATALDRADVEVTELSLRLPSLDDVFFALTGTTAADPDSEGEGGGDHVAEAARPPVLAVGGGAGSKRRSSALRDIATVARCYALRLARTPQLVFFGVVQPVLFVLGLSAVFATLVEQVLGGGEYIQYLLPGVLVMNLVLAAGGTAVGVAQDMAAGVIDRFRSLPMTRSAILAGRTITDLGRNAVAMTLMIATAFLLGYRLQGTLLGALAAFAVATLFSFACSWFFAWLGLAVKDPQAAQFASFAPVLPLVYLSGAWVPVETMQPGVRTFATHQPVNVVIEAVRGLAEGTASSGSVVRALLWSIGLLIVFSALATRRYARAG